MGRYEVAIVGAGIAGLSCGIAICAANNYEVTIFEEAPGLQEQGAGINLFPNATKILEQFNLDSLIRQRVLEHAYSLLVSHHNGEELCKIPNDASFHHGFPDMMVHRADLHRILYDCAKARGVKICHNRRLVSLQTTSASRVELIFEDRFSARADLVVGADGERSATRQLLEGVPAAFHDSGEHVYRTTIPMKTILQTSHLKSLVEPIHRRTWIGPAASVVMYPLERGDILNVVATNRHEITKTPSATPSSVCRDEVLKSYSNWDSRLQDLLKLGDNYMKWTLLASKPASSWANAQGTVLLIGDAAHAMPPYLGQGAAMAIEDAAVLGTLLAMTESNGELVKAVRVFQYIRGPRVLRVRELSLQTQSIFNLTDERARGQRDEAMKSSRGHVGHPLAYADPSFTDWLFNQDVCEEARREWEYRK